MANLLQPVTILSPVFFPVSRRCFSQLLGQKLKLDNDVSFAGVCTRLSLDVSHGVHTCTLRHSNIGIHNHGFHPLHSSVAVLNGNKLTTWLLMSSWWRWFLKCIQQVCHVTFFKRLHEPTPWIIFPLPSRR